jgi:hypothetical protein
LANSSPQDDSAPAFAEAAELAVRTADGDTLRLRTTATAIVIDVGSVAVLARAVRRARQSRRGLTSLAEPLALLVGRARLPLDVRVREHHVAWIEAGEPDSRLAELLGVGSIAMRTGALLRAWFGDRSP